MTQGKHLDPKTTKKLQTLYLETLDLLNGLYTLCDKELNNNPEFSHIEWGYYRRKWCKEDPEFKFKFDLVISNVVHKVENAMFSRIGMGDSQMIKFYLERKGDYLEKKESTITMNTPVQINIIKPEDAD